MKLSKLKFFSKKWLLGLILAVIMITGASGCSYSQKKPIAVDTYCAKHVPLKLTEATKKDILSVSSETFEYIEINETTYTCDCGTKTEKERLQCRADFLKIKNNR